MTRGRGLLAVEWGCWAFAVSTAASVILRALRIPFWGWDGNGSPSPVRAAANRLDIGPIPDWYGFETSARANSALSDFMTATFPDFAQSFPMRPPVGLGMGMTYIATLNGRGNAAVGYAVSLVGFVLAIAAALLLALLVRSARRGEAFSAQSIRRVTLLGWITAAGAFVVPGLHYLAQRHYLAGSGWSDQLTPSRSGWDVPNWGLAAAAAFLFVLSSVWRHGERLRRDTEGLV